MPDPWHQPLTQQCGHCWEGNWESWKKRQKGEHRKRTLRIRTKTNQSSLLSDLHFPQKKKKSCCTFSKLLWPLWPQHRAVFEPSTFSLGGDSVNHSTTVPPHPSPYIWEGAFRLDWVHATRLSCISQVNWSAWTSFNLNARTTGPRVNRRSPCSGDQRITMCAGAFSVMEE